MVKQKSNATVLERAELHSTAIEELIYNAQRSRSKNARKQTTNMFAI